MNAEYLLTLVHGVRHNGKGWMALCPAHADKNPSLSIREEGGKILMFCFAGCSTEAVLAALNIDAKDLFASDCSTRQIVAEYGYTDESGQLLYQVVRYEPKDFKQRRPDGQGGWIWNLNNVRRVLYQISDVIRAKSVIVVEGEKDVETGRKFGLAVTCNAGGAGKWREEYSGPLHGKRVAIIADTDGPGRKHAQQVAESLHGKVEALKLLELPGAKDLSEWVEHGGTREALLELIRNAPECQPSLHREESIGRITLVTADVFLSRSSSDERPWLAEGLLPAASQTIWQGRPKVGKSHSLFAACL